MVSDDGAGPATHAAQRVVSSELTAGFVGLGKMAAQHLDVLARLGGVRVTAVHDADEVRTAQVASQLGAESYRSWQELLDKAKPDVLWVCTPPGAHLDPTAGALERGMHVYLEKPIARTVKDGAAIAAAAHSSRAVCAVGYQWHALELLEVMRAALEGQAIGLVVSLSIGPTQSRSWFLKRSESGGNLLERGSHNVDLLRAVAGDVVAVQVAAGSVALAQAGAASKGDIDDAVVVLLRLKGGGVATMAVGWLKDDQPGRYSLDILAEESSLRLTLDPDFTLDGLSRGRAVAARAARHPLESSIVRFLDAVRTANPTMVACPPSDAIRTLEVIAACERALDTGELVAV